MGGYARSLGLPFGPKRIAINCDRLSEESDAIKEFILSRQVALFDKSSRCLHLPLAAVAVATAFIASSILFPSFCSYSKYYSYRRISWCSYRGEERTRKREVCGFNSLP